MQVAKSVVAINPDVEIYDISYWDYSAVRASLRLSCQHIKDSFETLSKLEGNIITIEFVHKENIEWVIKFAKQFNQVYCVSSYVLSLLHNELQEKIIGPAVIWDPEFDIRDNSIRYKIPTEYLYNAPYNKINRYEINGCELYCDIISGFIGKCKEMIIRCGHIRCFANIECDNVFIERASPDEIAYCLQNCRWKNITIKGRCDAPIRISPSILSIIGIGNTYDDQIRENNTNNYNSRFAKVKAIH